MNEVNGLCTGDRDAGGSGATAGASPDPRHSTAEDLAEDTLAKTWSARASFMPGTNLLAWTCIILRNLFLTQRRRARPTVEIDDHVVDRLIAGIGEHRHADSQSDEDYAPRSGHGTAARVLVRGETRGRTLWIG